MANVSFFEVLKRMADTDNKALQLAPLSNLSGARYGKHGTKITIGFPGNVCSDLMDGNFIGGLMLIRRDEYEKVKAELEKAVK